ncbi:YheC/YheD family protein [Paenibacillus arenilitoris]|uniref:YheC/YheD family protein n=1 Tax=Paenibacillus arenilitoris TaxID=2772299 RepID=A0A927CM21_9BACL|nr:YheC/YheD family protein [Paenibacillus arenilitoris]MBD2870524.1 YheC/YheD family protein [Paenibacillus arenilitoris]
MSYQSTSIGSKWIKTKWLLGKKNTRAYVPQTMPFTRGNLGAMLAQYATVYFKPTGGTGGSNINRIRKLKDGYQVQLNSNKQRYATQDELYEELKRRAKGRSYLLQKGIQLAEANGRPFDIRVMVQKSNEGTWKSTAIFTKIGKAGKVATNYHQGGELGYFKPTLAKAGFGKSVIARKEEELKQLGQKVGRAFDRHMKGFRELGLDVALDGEGNAWILEVNTRPQFYPLKQMGDKSMYRSIMSYAKQYGRKG